MAATVAVLPALPAAAAPLKSGTSNTTDPALLASIDNRITDPTGPAVASFVGKVTGLIPNDSSPATKAANAATLRAVCQRNSSVVIPRGTYYTDAITIEGPINLEGEDQASSVLRNNKGTVLNASGSAVNVARLTIRSDGGGDTIRQVGTIDQGHWDKVKLWQGGDGYSVWNNAGQMMIDMRFTNFLSWHTQTATVPAWKLVSAGGLINNNVWEKFRAQFSGNYHFWMESTDANTQIANVWRDANWEVCTGGQVKLIGCLGYIIENSNLWDLPGGSRALTTLKKHGIHADTNASQAVCHGIIRNHRRLDSTCDPGVFDIRLPSASKGDGTVLENCKNISSGNPLLIDLNSNLVRIAVDSGTASTLVKLSNASNAVLTDRFGIHLPPTQGLFVGGVAAVTGAKASVSGNVGRLAAGAEVDLALTVPGAKVGHGVNVSTRTMLSPGLAIVGYAVPAENKVTVRIRNHSTVAVTDNRGAARPFEVRLFA